MIPFNYHHLYYFYVIAEAGSIAKACETLLLAQPTLSTQLKQFETALGKRLFERNKQRLSLTEDGRMVLDYAEGIFEIGKELEEALLGQPRAGRPAVQVGVLVGTPRAFSHALLEQGFALHPDIHIGVREAGMEGLLEDLRQQKLDVILTDVSIRSSEQDEFVNRRVGKIPIVFAAAPALARKHPRVPQSLDGAPFILPSLPSQICHHLQDLFAEWRVKPRFVAEVQDVELARRLAVAGHGITALNATTVAASRPARSLVVLGSAERWDLYESVYLVARRRKRPNPVVEALLNSFRIT
ncbi:MAG: LysR family transcriptional regulator [Elusimicrobia bacterium]|nr:LysR family transcriptional regulator [Elusimicrobiota bacterium]